MVFKEERGKIEVRTRGQSIIDLCNSLNSVDQTTFYCEQLSDYMIITKKYFSDFFPFNFGHLGALMIEARSQSLGTQIKDLEFKIRLTSLNRFLVYGSTVFLIIIAAYFLLNGEPTMGLSFLGFAILGLGWMRVLYNSGLKNYLTNWDKYINAVL